MKSSDAVGYSGLRDAIAHEDGYICRSPNGLSPEQKRRAKLVGVEHRNGHHIPFIDCSGTGPRLGSNREPIPLFHPLPDRFEWCGLDRLGRSCPEIEATG